MAQYNLGNCYYNGYGVPQDYQQAAEWFRKAAEQGNTNLTSWVMPDSGFYEKAGSYDIYYAVQQDYHEPIEWYREAAGQGNAAAQYNLGVCYENGYGVPQDYEEAVKWYRQAAEQGHTEAQKWLTDHGK